MPRGLHADLALAPPRAAPLRWHAWELTPAEETGKEHALRAHRTQMEVMAPFLLAFVRRNELYAEEPLPAEAEIPTLGSADVVPDPGGAAAGQPLTR